MKMYFEIHCVYTLFDGGFYAEQFYNFKGDAANTVSRKIIEKNMGVFENTVDGVRRYWVEL